MVEAPPNRLVLCGIVTHVDAQPAGELHQITPHRRRRRSVEPRHQAPPRSPALPRQARGQLRLPTPRHPHKNHAFLCPVDHQAAQPLLLPALDEPRSHIRTSPEHHPTGTSSISCHQSGPGQQLVQLAPIVRCNVVNGFEFVEYRIQRAYLERRRPRRQYRVLARYCAHQLVEPLPIRLPDSPAPFPRKSAEDLLDRLGSAGLGQGRVVLGLGALDDVRDLALRPPQRAPIHPNALRTRKRLPRDLKQLLFNPVAEPALLIARKALQTPKRTTAIRERFRSTGEHPARRPHDKRIAQSTSAKGEKRDNIRVHTRILHVTHHTWKRMVRNENQGRRKPEQQVGTGRTVDRNPPWRFASNATARARTCRRTPAPAS